MYVLAGVADGWRWEAVEHEPIQRRVPYRRPRRLKHQEVRASQSVPDWWQWLAGGLMGSPEEASVGSCGGGLAGSPTRC